MSVHSCGHGSVAALTRGGSWSVDQLLKSASTDKHSGSNPQCRQFSSARCFVRLTHGNAEKLSRLWDGQSEREQLTSVFIRDLHSIVLSVSRQLLVAPHSSTPRRKKPSLGAFCPGVRLLTI